MRHRIMYQSISVGKIPEDCGNKNNLILRYTGTLNYQTPLRQIDER